MKKIFAILFLISFLAVLIIPLVTSAQGILGCCKVRKTFMFDGVTYYTNACYGPLGVVATDCPGGCLDPDGAGPILAVNGTEAWGMVCVLSTIYRVADLVFAILIAASILLILVAAYTFLTAGGAPEKVNKARDYILYALVGLVVAFLARAIPSIVNMLM